MTNSRYNRDKNEVPSQIAIDYINCFVERAKWHQNRGDYESMQICLEKAANAATNFDFDQTLTFF